MSVWLNVTFLGYTFLSDLFRSTLCLLHRKNHGFMTAGKTSNSVQMWELDHKEVWALKNWSFWTVVLKNTLENPLDCKEIKPVNPKGNQSWIFTGGIDTKAEAPVLQPPDAKNWLIGKDPDAGKDWRQEEKGMTEDEMVGWHHWLNGHEFEQALGDGEGQGSLACCSTWGHQESDITEWTTTVSSGIECCCKGVWDQLDSRPLLWKWCFYFFHQNVWIIFCFWLYHAAWGILVSWSGIKHRPWAVKAWCPLIHQDHQGITLTIFFPLNLMFRILNRTCQC